MKYMLVEIKNLGMNAEGVANIDGKILFIPNCLTGEKVECNIVKDFGNYAQCEIKNIVQKSPNRTTIACPYYFSCGGCSLQHMNYSEQLSFKQNLVKNTIKKIANIDCSVNQTVGCEKPFNYRNKISLSVANSKIGFKSKASDQVVDVDFCLLADEQINKTIKVIKEYLANNKIPSAKNIVIRHLEGQTLIAIVCYKNEDLNNLNAFISQHINNYGLFLVLNNRKDSVVLTNKIKHVGGLKNISLTNPLNLCLRLDSFYQTNSIIQNKLYQHILDQISNQDVVVNGYSGAGVLSALVAKKAKNVFGIEINKTAHCDAENLKKCNKISNLTNICGDFFKNYKKLEHFNTVILDPSKKGCGKAVMQQIKNVDKIIYVSCNPIALAKDLREILSTFKIESVQPFDMFPNTVSVETCVVLKRKS